MPLLLLIGLVIAGYREWAATFFMALMVILTIWLFGGDDDDPWGYQ